MCLQIIYKVDFALNHLQLLICHKTQLNKIKPIRDFFKNLYVFTNPSTTSGMQQKVSLLYAV